MAAPSRKRGRSCKGSPRWYSTKSAAASTRCSPARTWCASLSLFRCRVTSARRRRGGHGSLRRKAHGEAAACTELAVDVEARLVARDGVLDDGQAEARAAGFARAAAVDAVEALGEPRQMLRRDAGAGVLHREGGAVGSLAPGEAHLAAVRRVADGIADQVAERARQLGFRAEQVERRPAFHQDAVAAARQG